MTSNQIAARANVIAEERNELTAESNRIQEEYNKTYLAEFNRHNQSMEQIDTEKNRIQESWNNQSLTLTSEKQANDVRLAELGYSLQYANESAKRGLEAEKLELENRNLAITEQYNNALMQYNAEMADIAQQKNDIQSSYNEAMVKVAEYEAEIKDVNARINALNSANQVVIAKLNNDTSRWAAVVNFSYNMDRNATERRGQDINAETQRRGQNLNYDLGTQTVKESHRHNVVSEVEQGVQTLGNIVLGRQGLLGFIMFPNKAIKDASVKAREAWDALWR